MEILNSSDLIYTYIPTLHAGAERRHEKDVYFPLPFEKLPFFDIKYVRTMSSMNIKSSFVINSWLLTTGLRWRCRAYFPKEKHSLMIFVCSIGSNRFIGSGRRSEATGIAEMGDRLLFSSQFLVAMLRMMSGLFPKGKDWRATGRYWYSWNYENICDVKC